MNEEKEKTYEQLSTPRKILHILYLFFGIMIMIYGFYLLHAVLKTPIRGV